MNKLNLKIVLPHFFLKKLYFYTKKNLEKFLILKIFLTFNLNFRIFFYCNFYLFFLIFFGVLSVESMKILKSMMSCKKIGNIIVDEERNIRKRRRIDENEDEKEGNGKIGKNRREDA